jgi:ribose transport system ATP-binding protein
MNHTPLLEMEGIVRRFPGVLALDGVSFDLRGGEVHALVGENGAGKSTLMKILNGALRADAGEIRVDGKPVQIATPAAAARLGIGMVYQEPCLAPHLTVGENILLGREPVRAGLVDFAALHRQAQEALDRLQCGISSRTRVSDLGIAGQQMVEIARALSQDVRFLIMDEPTAPLSESESKLLFDRLRALRAQGVGIAYISHRLEEVMALSDRVTVLRDGRRVASLRTAETNAAQLVRLMVGRELGEVYPAREGVRGEELLRVEGLRRPPALVDASFTLHRGEVVGLGGLMGAGRTELARALFGADRPTGGQVFVRGRPMPLASPQRSIAAGMAFLTEDRKRDGLALGLSVRANITLANLRPVMRGGFLDVGRERQVAAEYAQRVDVRAGSLEQPARSLSGGNQQKVVLAKWLLTQAQVFLFDEPTQGIDVGARAEVYGLINELARQGAGILLISSYLPELLALSDRILVMSRGRIVGELAREEATQERVMELAALGHHLDSPLEGSQP